MNANPAPELRRELLDDFYAECDELLTAVRGGLAALEGHAGGAAPEAGVSEALFRSMHTFKGNAAIVGLRPAEQLAHGMEEVLRSLARSSLALTQTVLDLLLAATQQLERIVVAHRLGRDLPDPQDLLLELRQLQPTGTPPDSPAHSSAAGAPAATSAAIAAARRRGLTIFHASFAPSRELDHRGVNVKTVRERLGALGEIIAAAPSVGAAGSFVFNFMLGLREAPADLAPWESDGIRLAPAAAPPASTETEARGRTGAEPLEAFSLTPSHIVRVDLARLDDLMRIAGELVIQRSRLEDRLQRDGAGQSALRDLNLGMTRSLRELREAITRVRMVPIAEIFTRMPFVVRDLRRGSGKKVRVELEDNQTEVDKYLVERLKEPLLHLVRNAVAHGIEDAADRVAAGKPEEATIVLRARSAGESVLLQVRDDGRGIDTAAVVARAAALGLPAAAPLDSAGVLQILCGLGFSTRETADRGAGRGVGMAVVANAVKELGGTLGMETSPGAGTAFTLRLPLSLSIAEALIVGIDRQTCALPQSAVDEIVQASAEELRSLRQAEVVPYRGGLLPLVWLRAMFGDRSRPGPTWTILVVSSDRGAAGLVVDRVLSQREVVIRQLADPLLHVPGISGVTELGDGRPVLLLDPNAITQGVVRPPDSILASTTPGAGAPAR